MEADMKTHGRAVVHGWHKFEKAFWRAESEQYVPMDGSAGIDHDDGVSRALQAGGAEHD